MEGNVQKFGFLRNPLSKSGWYMVQKYLFLRWIFFSKSLKKFSSRRIVTFNISGRFSKIISLLSKKNWSHTTHRSKDIDKKPVRFEKKPGLELLPFYHCRYSHAIKRFSKRLQWISNASLKSKNTRNILIKMCNA